ncbi:MAG TPA: hypothetical protein ENJ12_12135 [Thiolapillus brandeum]|uniref:Uncharacterized protein n=1 Tax=Thiolapillus brandeum TaxID=1076588 RepID=A0A831RWX6_9GAMM|nr:hypothetical protein [Thiolapillus brandeum]
MSPSYSAKFFDTAFEPGHTDSVEFSLNVLSVCNDAMYQDGSLNYYGISTSSPIHYEVAEKQCETSTLLLAGPTYSGTGTTYFSSQAAIETDPSPGTTIAVENPHKLILEAPVFRVKDGDDFIIRSGARLRIYGKSVTCH